MSLSIYFDEKSNNVDVSGENFPVTDVNLFARILNFFTSDIAHTRIIKKLSKTLNKRNLDNIYQIIVNDKMLTANGENLSESSIETFLRYLAISNETILNGTHDDNDFQIVIPLKTIILNRKTLIESILRGPYTDEIKEIYKTFSASLTVRNRIGEQYRRIRTVNASNFFSSIDYINLSIQKRLSTFNAYPILPLNESGFAPFLQSCQKIGNKISTNYIVGEMGNKLKDLKSALTYFVLECIEKLASYQESQENFETIISMSFKEKALEVKGKGKSRLQFGNMQSTIFSFSKSKNYKPDVGYVLAVYIYDFMRSYNSELKGSPDSFTRALNAYYKYVSELTVSVDHESDDEKSEDENPDEEYESEDEEKEDENKESYTVHYDILNKLENIDEIDHGILSGFISVFMKIFFSLKPSNKKNNAKSVTPDKINSFKRIYFSSSNSMKPYWWQAKCIQYAKEGISYLNIGPTSGGKTFGSINSIGALFSNYRDGKIVYSSPTDQLAIQTFSGLYVSFEELSSKMALICECCVYIPNNARIFIGTPKRLNEYFTKIRQDFLISKDSKKPAIVSIPESVDKLIESEVDVLIIDEVHTISKGYNTTEEGKIVSKATESLIPMISTVNRKSKYKPVFIGLSATLADSSSDDLINLIKSKTGIEDIRKIKYTYKDIGKISEPTASELRERQINNSLPQIKMPLCKINSVLREARQESDLRENVEINPQLLEELMYLAIEEDVTPLPFFFDTEAEAITNYKTFISYVNRRIGASQWKSFCDSYKSTDMTDKTMETFEKKLEEKIVEISTVPARSDETCFVRAEKFDELIAFFNARSNKKIDTSNPIVYSIDFYGFLWEYNYFYTNRKRFRIDNTHPYYDFANGGYKINLDENEIMGLLEAQNIMTSSVSDQKIIQLISEGFKFGLGNITSSIPLGFQMGNTKIVNDLRKNKDDIKTPFVFCDSSISMGVDLPFNGVAIIQSSMRDITPSSFLQKNGRGGRTNNMGQTRKAITFLINVSNALDNISIEELPFENTFYSSRFFTRENICENLAQIVQIANSYKNNLKQQKPINSASFNRDDCFPGISSVQTEVQKLILMKNQLAELYEICKVMCPNVADNYIKPLFLNFQKQTHLLIMGSAN